MGYSISVKFGSKRERDRMWAFLQQQDVARAAGRGKVAPVPVMGTDLSYPPPGSPELVLGVNSATLSPTEWAVMAWVATQSALRRDGHAVVFVDEEPCDVITALTAHAASTGYLVDRRGVVLPKGTQDDITATTRDWLGQMHERWKTYRNAQPLPPPAPVTPLPSRRGARSGRAPR